jgi:hypothetical protein
MANRRPRYKSVNSTIEPEVHELLKLVSSELDLNVSQLITCMFVELILRIHSLNQLIQLYPSIRERKRQEFLASLEQECREKMESFQKVKSEARQLAVTQKELAVTESHQKLVAYGERKPCVL